MSIEKKARKNGIDLYAKHLLNQVAYLNKSEIISKKLKWAVKELVKKEMGMCYNLITRTLIGSPYFSLSYLLIFLKDF